jgi:hypothetical protein
MVDKRNSFGLYPRSASTRSLADSTSSFPFNARQKSASNTGPIPLRYAILRGLAHALEEALRYHKSILENSEITALID